jgi:hypothetical protein
MTHSRRVVFTTFVVVVGGVLLQGGRVLSQQREQAQSSRREVARLEMQLAAQRREYDATTRELTLAERQLAELSGPTNPALSEIERAREAEIGAWLARVKRLKQLFVQRPDQRIPEMRLLTDDDWLRLSKRLELDNEANIRKALAAARSAAKSRLAASLVKALPKFAQASGGEPPATVMALAPYLENPADAEFLPHLEVTSVNRSAESARYGILGWAIQEKTAVDADYDGRYCVNPNGGTAIFSAPQAWIPDFMDRQQRAYRDFSAANKGVAPVGMEQVLPYFNPPLDPAITEKLLKAEREGWR